MPTYDYRCNNCEHEFELFQSMSASHKRKCPECGKNALERLIGTGAAVMMQAATTVPATPNTVPPSGTPSCVVKL